MATSASSSSFTSAITGRAVGGAAVWGALAGVAASMVMAIYAMIAAATYQHTGFFTPLYHIAATFIAPDAMMTSMMRAGEGSAFYFSLGPAVLGALIHMMVGAMYGAIFAVGARLAKLHGLTLVAAAMVWGLVVFALSTWIGLPIAAALFGGGDPIATMATMVGYPTFLVEHLLYGGALGMMLAARPSNR
ncbi:hypothetical protein [Nocardia cyriacigeorgica]|uniref:hypothetical protein n=1 Tax=Nocardia cyriacigeorgica TaxID=135487 RepID=UPI003510F052